MGPQWFFQKGDISVLGVVQRRWYGEKAYSTGVGGRVEGQYWLTKLGRHIYHAPIDTTFALHRPGVPWALRPAIRTG